MSMTKVYIYEICVIGCAFIRNLLILLVG